MTRLKVGLSTCPNDTFLFHPLLEGQVDTRGLELSFELADVEQLNRALVAGRLDVSKASFATALRLADHYGVLPVGAALGFGVGPVLLGGPGVSALSPDATVLCPGEGTTATLLMRCLHPELRNLEQVCFDEIMPRLLEGSGAQVGVCIHEGRFTWAAAGLSLLEDLGASWETLTGTPVPLGGLLARLELGERVHATLVSVLADSLAAARAAPEATLPTMRRHAQELSDEVLWQHVELYVNDRTADLGGIGRRCLKELATRAGVERGLKILGGS